MQGTTILTIIFVNVMLGMAKKTAERPFLALLIDPNRPEQNCMGVIITDRWIVNHCRNFYGIEFTQVKVQSGCTYQIAETHVHPQYTTVPFVIQGYDTRSLFAGTDTIILHKTEKTIALVEGLVDVIRINADNDVSRQNHMLVRNSTGGFSMMRRRVNVTTRSYCDIRMSERFEDGQQIYLSMNQLCVLTRWIVRVPICCIAQAFIIHSGQLLGLMSWSTTCSFEVKIDPWVFIRADDYIDWVHELTNYGSFSPEYTHRRHCKH